jgi:aryl-alcohol dehydrogenase-like predicted oxidoreductase
MRTRKIGSLDVSVVGLGCNNFGWRIDSAATANVVEAALDAGINFLDTADIYDTGRSEEFLGKALKSSRNKVVLATKFGMKMGDLGQGASPEHIRRSIEGSLLRLETDRIDLYQIHQPDPNTPIADTLGALDDLVKEGKVREIGCSNFSAEQLREASAAVSAGAAAFVSVQNEYSLVKREPESEVLPECERLGLAFLPYFPLASGLLTGKYRKGTPLPQGSRGEAGFGPKVYTHENLELVESLITFAEQRGHTLLELAFSWLLARPVVASVIAGATSARQIEANAAASSWELTRQDLAGIEKILAG